MTTHERFDLLMFNDTEDSKTNDWTYQPQFWTFLFIH